MKRIAVSNTLAILLLASLAGCADEIAVNAAVGSRSTPGTQWPAPAAGKADGDFQAYEYH